MKKASTIFLKVAISLVGLITLLLFIFRVPYMEGRNFRTVGFIYFADPLVITFYALLIPFYIALYQTFRLLDYIEKDKVFTLASVKALKNIKYCVFSVIGLILLEVMFVSIFGQEEKGPVMAMGVYFAFMVSAVATFVAVLQKLLQRAVDLKSENDLTV